MGIGGGGVPVLVSRLGFLVLGMRVPVLLPLWVRAYYCLSSSVLSYGTKKSLEILKK